MSKYETANDDSVSLQGVMREWMTTLQEHSVEAIVVLGPDPFGARDLRRTLAAHPASALEIALALAASDEYGAAWGDSDAPLVAWQHIAKSSGRTAHGWRMLALDRGLQTLVRVAFTLPAGRAFECFLFSPREFADRGHAMSIVWSVLNVWPILKRGIADAHCTLSPRERQALALAFQGQTAEQSALVMGCASRTVNFHISNAIAKLQAVNKLAAIQRACWLGAI